MINSLKKTKEHQVRIYLKYKLFNIIEKVISNSKI